MCYWLIPYTRQQKIKSAYQGSFLPDQGRVVSVHFWHGFVVNWGGAILS
jgi:hypothetical protein